MKTIGITGGSGFIGSHIARRLHQEGHQVILFDRSKREIENGELFLGDVRDRAAVFELAAHVDGIIHLAAVLGTQETIGNPWPAVETNMLGGVNILEAAREYKTPLVYAGVGNYWMHNTYSTTKTATERLLNQFRDEFNLPMATVRPVNAYGPGQRVAPPFGPGKVKKIMPAFTCRALTGQDLEIYGDGKQISDMVFVEDVARVFTTTLSSLFEGNIPKYPLEVGPTDSLTVNQVGKTVIKIAKALTGKESGIKHLPMRPGEKDTNDLAPEKVESILSSISDEETKILVRKKLRELGVKVVAEVSTLKQVGIDPKEFTPFEVGADLTVKWFHENKGITWMEPENT